MDNPPFTVAGSFSDASASPPPAVTYAGDNGRFQIQIGEASTVDANASGQFIFLGDTDNDNAPNTPNVDIFATVLDLRNRLRDGTITDPASTVLDDLDAALAQVLRTRGTLGATLNRLDMTAAQLGSLEVTLEIERSSIEDLDIIEASTRLQSRETTFQASLAVTARVIQPSLLNFLS